MNFTEKLKEVLGWIKSHAQRLSRHGLTIKNPLENARVYFFEANTHTPQPVFADEGLGTCLPQPILLNGQGLLSQEVYLKSDQMYRFEVRDETGEMLFTQDNIRGDQLT